MNDSIESDHSDTPATRPPRWSYAVLGIVVLLIFGISISYNFTHWDDIELIIKNPAVITPSYQGFIQTWTEPFFQIYMPLTYSLWIIEGIPARFAPPLPGSEATSGFAPWIYHLGTFFLYFGCCFQAYRLIQRLVRDTWAALLGAIFFAVHPLQAESASWISENKGLIATFFGLWALGYYIDAVRADDSRERFRLYATASILFILALLGKPWAAAIPIMAAVIDFCFLRQPVVSTVKRVTPWILVAVGMIFITQRVQTTADLMVVAAQKRPFIATDAIVFYVQKLVFPYPLMIDYGRSPVAVLRNASAPELIGVIALAGIGLALLALVIARRWVILGVVALFLAALLPNLGLVPFAFQGFSTVADRYVAPALIAPALGWALLAQWLQKPALKALLTIPLVFFGALAFQQSLVWHDNDSLFSHTIEHNPKSPAALINRSKTRIEQGDYEGGMSDALTCMTHAPDFVPAYLNYAQCNVALRHNEEALKALDKVLEMKPHHEPALEFKVHILQFLHRYKEAIPSLIELQKVVGENRSLKYRQARLLILTGNTDEGLKMFEEVNGKKMSRAEREFVEAQVFEQANEFAEASKRYRFIVSHYPGNTELADMRLAWVLATATNSADRKPEEALGIIKRIVGRSKSPNAVQLDILAAAQAATGDFASAIVTANDAVLSAQRERNPKLEIEIGERLKGYSDRKPYVIPEPKITMPQVSR